MFPVVSGGLPELGATRDARDVRNKPHCRSRSRLSISGGSGCADGFLVGVPFTLQWKDDRRVGGAQPVVVDAELVSSSSTWTMEA